MAANLTNDISIADIHNKIMMQCNPTVYTLYYLCINSEIVYCVQVFPCPLKVWWVVIINVCWIWENKWHNEQKNSTQTSHVLTNRTTNRARMSLISKIWRVLMLYHWYDRSWSLQYFRILIQYVRYVNLLIYQRSEHIIFLSWNKS